MGSAIDATSLKEGNPTYQEKLAEKEAKTKAKSDFGGKTFEELNSTQKDELLKVLGIQAGLLSRS